jgi:hypothetical protein
MIILKWIFNEEDRGSWTGSSWLGIGTDGGRFWMWLWTFRFHKMQGISWQAEDLVAFQGLYCMQFIYLFAYMLLHILLLECYNITWVRHHPSVCRIIRRNYVDIYYLQLKKYFYHEKLNHSETDKFITFCAEFTTEVNAKNTASFIMWPHLVWLKCSDVSEESTVSIWR